ncbi:hypothetical protein [Flammeovirga agarivorans]|uniref:Uncharacterized protein n=1 Tax=Flammeovirga agarivorans TaxID=2726742 RepID=A0A7X8SNS6_9BACT|nr:hypothetical protein [Flammeovirga agarivorans]NLR93630.1 hypothetical protein [Flammeovirga agarivorans]
MKSLYLTFCLLFLSVLGFAQDKYSLFEGKLVMAQNHPLALYSAQSPWYSFMEFDNYANLGANPNRPEATYLPLISEITNPLFLDDAVEFEMKAAIASGIDGFQFVIRYASVRNIDLISRIIAAYHRVAEEKKIDFKFSLYIDFHHSRKQSSSQMIQHMKVQLQNILELTSKSTKWVRSSDNEILTLTATTESIIEDLNITKKGYTSVRNTIHNDLSYIDKVYYALIDIQSYIKQPLAIVYQVRFLSDTKINQKILDHFKSVWYVYNQNKVADQSIYKLLEKNDRAYIQYVSPQKSQVFFTNKNEPKLAVTAVKQTAVFQDELESAVLKKAKMINLDSWNDYRGSSHLAPELYHNMGYSLLINYYKNKWGKSTSSSKEFVMLSYQTVKSDALLQKEMPLHVVERYGTLEDQDKVEITTYLNQPAEVFCNGKLVGFAAKGRNNFYVDIKKGNVEVLLKRDNIVCHKLIGATPIRKKAYRQNFLCNTYTTSDEELLNEIISLAAGPILEKNRLRFLLTQKQLAEIKKALINKVTNDISITRVLEISDAALVIERQKINKNYEKEMKKILGDIHFEIWKDIQNESHKVSRNIENLYKESDNNNNYNLLQPTEF